MSRGTDAQVAAGWILLGMLALAIGLVFMFGFLFGLMVGG